MWTSTKVNVGRRLNSVGLSMFGPQLTFVLADINSTEKEKKLPHDQVPHAPFSYPDIGYSI